MDWRGCRDGSVETTLAEPVLRSEFGAPELREKPVGVAASCNSSTWKMNAGDPQGKSAR